MSSVMLDTLSSLWVHGDIVLMAYTAGISIMAILLLAVLAMLMWDAIVNRGVNRAMARLRKENQFMSATTVRRASLADRPHAAIPVSQVLPAVDLHGMVLN